MFTVIFQKFIIFLAYPFFVEGKDILNLFRPKPDLPQELNDFLKEVQQHKKDFAFIRNIAKNRRKYEKSFAENHNLFAEDLDNQLTMAPYYNKRYNNFENQNSQIEDNLPDIYDQVARSPEFDGESSFRSYYPNERYSRFIHSPIRLRRELNTNYVDSHVKIKPNGIYGEIKRPEPKFPVNRFVDNNKYHTGYLVGVENDEDDEDLLEEMPTDKKKRAVEINIKSDGKLIKRIEEDENGPKSIVLNIKANNPKEKSQILDNSVSQATEASNAVEQTPINKILENIPGNSKTIPSLSNSNGNQNGAQDKNVGVPINSIPASNSAFLNIKNGQSSSNQKTSNQEFDAKSEKESASRDKSSDIQKFDTPVSNSEELKEKIDSINSKSFNGYNRQPQEHFENSRWIGDKNQMAKSIDLAQNNVNRIGSIKEKPSMGTDLEQPKKESEFEKVQALVVDSTQINENGMQQNKVKYANKRQLNKEKRWDEMQDMDSNSIPLDVQEILSKEAVNKPFDYAQSLEQEAVDFSNLNSSQENPEHMQWKTGDHEIHLNPNEKYEIIEQSTKNILIIPILQTTTPCAADVRSNEEEEAVEAKIIGDAIAQEIEKEKEEETKKDNEETTECKTETQSPKHHQKEEQLEVIRPNKDEQVKSGPDKNINEKVAEIEIVRQRPAQTHYEAHDQHKGHERKRQIVKKKKPKYVIKNRKTAEKLQYHSKQYNDEVPNQFKSAQKEQNHMDDDPFRDRKHMPPVPKYKRKRVRQHPKKRVDRVKDSSLVDYYHFNEIYGPPDETFDFIPSFHKRQLQSANYEFDPNLISDVDNHEDEEIKKFERAQEEKKNMKLKFKTKGKDEKKFRTSSGFRKKFKSEGDYSDEEESLTVKSASINVPIKKSKNHFAPLSETTTEENDDDYNYEDLSDMEDEEEDVAYEEEKIDDLDVDEQIGSNNSSDLENDRLNIKNSLKAAYLAFPISTTKKYREKPLIIEVFHTYLPIKPKDKELEDEEENGGKIQQVKDEHTHVRGHGSSHRKHRKKKKKKPKRSDEILGDRLIKTNDRSLTRDVSSFHGRGNQGFKPIKRKQMKPKREDTEPATQKREGLASEKMSKQFEKKPLSDQQKQDIFLRYNPEFQRWPRFVQSDNAYRQLMKRRSLENQKRYLRNLRNMNRSPISNEYFLYPKKSEFVKRAEPATETTAAAAAGSTEPSLSTVAAETAASTAAEESKESSTTEESPNEQKQETFQTSVAQSDSAHAQDNLDGETLPQAAKNILQTANSDIFENTTAPLLQGAENEGASVVGNSGSGASGEATQFQFTTNADDLTQNTQCMTPNNKQITACPDESATHSPVTITSILPIVHESATLLKMNMSQSEYLDLNDIVGGILPRLVVSESLSGARGTIRQSLNTGKFNINVNLSNYNNSAETNLILKEMTNLMLKLKYHTTCQVLPVNLNTYLKTITKNEMDDPMAKLKEMEEIDFDVHQSGYVFHTGGGSDSVHEKANVLKELLDKYNNLPNDCKERAEPVKEYIESHLAMIDGVSGKRSSNPPMGATLAENGTTIGHAKAKKEVNFPNPIKAQEKELSGQMMEEGLNNQNPNANEAIEDKEKKNKRQAEDFKFRSVYRRELSTSTSPQYGKLAEAVRKMRHRRESIKRIGEIYGKAKREEVYKDDTQEQYKKEDKGFEAPLVINF